MKREKKVKFAPFEFYFLNEWMKKILQDIQCCIFSYGSLNLSRVIVFTFFFLRNRFWFDAINLLMLKNISIVSKNQLLIPWMNFYIFFNISQEFCFFGTQRLAPSIHSKCIYAIIITVKLIICEVLMNKMCTAVVNII